MVVAWISSVTDVPLCLTPTVGLATIGYAMILSNVDCDSPPSSAVGRKTSSVNRAFLPYRNGYHKLGSIGLTAERGRHTLEIEEAHLGCVCIVSCGLVAFWAGFFDRDGRKDISRFGC